MVYIVLIAGLFLIAALLFRCALLGLAAYQRHAYERERHRMSLEEWRLRVATAQTRLESAVAQTKYHWEGNRKFQVKRKVIENEEGTICSFYLWPHDERSLPPFHPGQFLTFDMAIPGQKRRLRRCYSLSDGPDPDFYRVSIKKIPDGVSSSYFHDNIHEGDLLDVRAPAGRFCIDLSEDSPLVLIAGGVGLTPCLSMINAVAKGESTRETWLFYGVRNEMELTFARHLLRLDREHEQLHVHICLSGLKEDQVKGKPNYHAGRVSVDLLNNLLPSNNYDYYICGPAKMMEAFQKDLKAWDVPAERIHVETFIPPALPKPPVDAKTAGASLHVTFSKSGKTIAWDPTAGSLLDFAEKQDVSIECGCRQGNCGSCETAIRQGEVTYLAEPVFPDLKTGSCLACICAPSTDVVLDA